MLHIFLTCSLLPLKRGSNQVFKKNTDSEGEQERVWFFSPPAQLPVPPYLLPTDKP
jgi:hypothetical protein